MTQNELYVLINTKPYEFLYTDPHLGERIISSPLAVPTPTARTSKARMSTFVAVP